MALAPISSVLQYCCRVVAALLQLVAVSCSVNRILSDVAPVIGPSLALAPISSVLQYCCNAVAVLLQCCCSVLQCAAVSRLGVGIGTNIICVAMLLHVLQCNVVCCSKQASQASQRHWHQYHVCCSLVTLTLMLQCIACCSELQCVAVSRLRSGIGADITSASAPTLRRHRHRYRVPTISRLLKIIGLFYKRAL